MLSLTRSRLSLICLGLIYWASRLHNLALLPIFVDEGIAIEDASLLSRYGNPIQSLADNSKWLHAWLLHLGLPFYPTQMLWLGRFASVICGWLVCWACLYWGRRFFSRPVGLVAVGLYILSPFSLFNDRLLEADGLSGALLAWATVWALQIVTGEGSWKQACLLAAALGAAALSKTVNLIGLAIPLACLLVYPDAWRSKRILSRLLLAYALAAVLLAPVFVALSRAGAHIARHSVTSLPITDMSEQWLQNLGDAAVWLVAYLGPVLSALLVLALLRAVLVRHQAARLASFVLLGPLAAYVLISQSWFPRYLTIVMAPLYLLLAWLLVDFAETVRAIAAERWPAGARRTAGEVIGAGLFLLLLIGFPLQFDRWLLVNPVQAPFPEIDRRQYVEGWTAGYGVPEAAAFLLAQTNGRPGGQIALVRHYLWDPLNPGLEPYLAGNAAIQLHTLDLGTPDTVDKVRQMAQQGLVYIAVNSPRIPARFREVFAPHADPVVVYAKPGGRYQIELWKVH